MYKKKLLSIVVTMAFSLLVFAQVENTHIKSSYIIVKYKMGGAIEALTKEQTYKIVFPTELNYHKEIENTYRWDTYYMSMTAKKVKPTEQSYKTIEVVTKGLVPLGTYEDVQVPLSTDPSRKGWVRKVNYTFPIKLVMRNAANEIEKELVLTDDKEVLQGVFHADMLTEDGSKRIGERDIVPFMTVEQLLKAATPNKVAIEKRLERNQVLKFYPAISKAIAAAYDLNKVSSFNMAIYQITKDELGNYPAVASMSDKFSIALKDLTDDTKKENAINTLQECNTFYKEQLAQKDKLPADIVKLCLYHEAIASLMLGDIPESNSAFSAYYTKYMRNTLFGEQTFEENYNKLYNIYAPYYSIKQATSVSVNMNVPVIAYRDKVQADIVADKAKLQNDSIAKAEEEAKSPNINGKPGYIVLNSGKKVEGKIHMLFVETSSNSGIIDLDRFSSVDVGNTVNGVENKTKYMSKDVSYFIVNDLRYEHLNVKEGAVLGMLGKLTGNTDPTTFYIKYYTANNFTLYQRPASKEFIIKKNTDELSYYTEEVLKGKKVAIPFIEACPALKQKIEAKNIEDIKDAKKMTDWLDVNCK